MLIPLGTDVRLRRPTLVTYVLMALCVFAFIGQEIVDTRTPLGDPAAYSNLMLYGYDGDVDRIFVEHSEVATGERSAVRINPPRWYQFVTYQFLHGGWMHLLGNMLFLFVFGPAVEDRFRRSGFLAFYLLGGVLAGAAHGLLETTTISQAGILARMTTPVIGASGSIAAVTGAYLVLFPLAPVRVFLIFFYIGRYAIPGWIFVLLGVLYDLVFLASGAQGVAHIAHLGGYATGAGVAMFLLWRRMIPREPYDLFSMAKQAHRRRQYRSLVTKGPARSPFVKDASEHQHVKARAKQDPHGPARRAIATKSATDPGGAADAYLELLREDAKCVLSRDAQLVIANALYERGDHQNALDAYERFLNRHPDDREADQTRLMAAMIAARQLNDPVGATRLLDAIDDELLDDGLRDLARTIREELA